MMRIHVFVGFNLVLGTLSTAVEESVGPQRQMFQNSHSNRLLAKRQLEPPPSLGESLEDVLGEVNKMENLFSANTPLPGMPSDHKRITAFKKDIGPAELPIPGAKHITLWYNGPEFPKQHVKLAFFDLCS